MPGFKPQGKPATHGPYPPLGQPRNGPQTTPQRPGGKVKSIGLGQSKTAVCNESNANNYFRMETP